MRRVHRKAIQLPMLCILEGSRQRVLCSDRAGNFYVMLCVAQEVGSATAPAAPRWSDMYQVVHFLGDMVQIILSSRLVTRKDSLICIQYN